MKRLSIKTFSILLTMLVILLPLTMSLSVSAKVAVPLPEIPDENAEPVQPPSMGCPQAFSADGYRHPLQEIKVENSKELENPEKHRVIFRVLESPDVQNVLRENSAKIDLTTAMATMHTLDIGNTLLVVRILIGERALIYYELAEPLIEPGKRYKSQAMLLAFEEETVRLITTSINGRLVSLGSSPRQMGVTMSCGNCTDMFNWTYQSWSCTSWNGSCLIQCGFSCGGCLAPCGGCLTLGYWWLCSACASCALGCGWCTSQCCQNWESVCPWCGTP